MRPYCAHRAVPRSLSNCWLEKSEDKQMIWRKHVNHKLKNDYKKIFRLIDKIIFLKAPSFKYVFKWR